MKKWDKKTIMYRLDNIIPDDFECDGMRITFPNDSTALIKLTNRSDAELKDEQEMIEADADPLG